MGGVLLNDIKKLSLEKYISEIVAAILEGLSRCKLGPDVAAAVEVISALHQRFPDTFTLLFTYHLAKALAPSPKLTHQQLAQAGTTPEQREKEETARVSKQRILCRVAADLWLVGVLRNVEDGVATLTAEGTAGVSSKTSQVAKDSVAALLVSQGKDSKGAADNAKAFPNFVYSILHDLLVGDRDHVNLPILLTVLKAHGREFTGIAPRKSKTSGDGKDSETKPATDDGNPAPLDNIVPPAQQQLFKTMFVEYYKGLEGHLVRDHKELKKLERKNESSLFSRGELSEERQQQYEKQFKAVEKLTSSTQSVADALDLDMPILKDEKEDLIGIVESTGGSEEKGALSSVFEDEDSIVFYEQILDLRTLVPRIFLETSKAKKDKKEEGNETEKDGDKSASKDGQSASGGDRQNKDTGDELDDLEESADVMMESIDAELDEMNLDENTGTESYLAEETITTTQETSTTASKTTATQLEAFLAKLPSMCNRDMIDQAAVDFCYLNTKLHRNRLIKTLVQVPRDRHDLLPYYARMIATFKPFYPDVAEEVLAALEREFRGLLRKKHLDLSESRVKNIKFLSELVKFGITPLPIIFHCLKVLLEEFVPQNIIVACALLETCGRFLKRKSTATSTRLDAMLDILKRKKTAFHLEPRFLLMIDNAYYQCNPPEQKTRQKREIPPIEQFIRKLLYMDLSKKNVDSTHKLLRKLDWNNKETYDLVLRLFSKVWKIKFSNIHLMAILVNGLNRYHPDFSIAVVDSVVESIKLGMEQNDFRHNQRRIAVVKFLGELYNYRMIDNPLIFSTLDTLISTGHEQGRASPDRPSPIDAPNDCFRIRLVCTLLDTCGLCFDHGSSKIKLDAFLVIFQMYVLSKEAIPLEVEYMIEDTFSELRPKLRRFLVYEEALAAVDALHGPTGGNDQSNMGHNDDSDSEDSEGDDDGDDDQDDDEDDESDDEDDGLEDEDEMDAMRQTDDEEQAVVLTNQHKPVEEVDEEFEREYLKMMTESLESRKFERKHLTLDVAIPVLRSAGMLEDRLLKRCAPNLSLTMDEVLTRWSFLLNLLDRREEPVLTNPDHVAFTLLTKKGNKQQLRTVGLPSDSALVINTRNQREAEREEQQQLKQIVLEYEVREEANQRAAVVEKPRN
ncbi:armadillo-type protein [Mortierella sp. GBAus27b]|nr:armadillo-type protein [Mortierella sp. GBAus27b]